MIAVDVTLLDRSLRTRAAGRAADVDGESAEALSPEVVAEAIRAAGASGLCLELHDDESWQRLATWRQAAARTRLPIVAVGVRLDVRQPEPDPRVIGLLEQQDLDEGTLLQVSLYSSHSQDVPSAPRADAPAIALLRRLLDSAGSRTLIALVPESERWLARVQDAVRLGMRINRPGLGIAIDSRTITIANDELESTLHLALPRLWNMIVPMHEQPAGGQGDRVSAATIYAGARRLGYSGPVTIDCESAQSQQSVSSIVKQAIGAWRSSLPMR
jgi:sugar phosphate isomerase/epimerase